MIKVDQGKCSRCGICSEVCPIGILQMGESGPRLVSEQLCIGCGHCTAICPHAALDNEKAPLAGQVALDGWNTPDAQTAEQFLRFRRSIRAYRQEKVLQETLYRLLNIARFAPTGGNSQGLSYLVIEDEERLARLSDGIMAFMGEQAKTVPWLQAYNKVAASMRERGKDFIFRSAPQLIIATAPRELPMGRDNARFSLAYVELFAPTLGLGACWAGLAEMCVAAGYKPVLDLLDIPEGRTVAGIMMVGYPKYKYQRLPDRDPLLIEWR